MAHNLYDCFSFHSYFNVFGGKCTLDIFRQGSLRHVYFYEDFLVCLPPLSPLCFTRDVTTFLIKVGHDPFYDMLSRESYNNFIYKM